MVFYSILGWKAFIFAILSKSGSYPFVSPVVPSKIHFTLYSVLKPQIPSPLLNSSWLNTSWLNTYTSSIPHHSRCLSSLVSFRTHWREAPYYVVSPCLTSPEICWRRKAAPCPPSDSAPPPTCYLHQTIITKHREDPGYNLPDSPAALWPANYLSGSFRGQLGGMCHKANSCLELALSTWTCSKLLQCKYM